MIRSSKLGSLAYIAMLLFFLTVSLGLVAYIGYGEACREYPRLAIESAGTMGEIVQTRVESLLNAGLPLKQFAGFSLLADPLLRSSNALSAIYVTDDAGNLLFATTRPGTDIHHAIAATAAMAPLHSLRSDFYTAAAGREYYAVRLPLHSKVEVSGQLSLLLSRKVLVGEIIRRFLPVIWGMVGMAVLGILAIVLLQQRLPSRRHSVVTTVFSGVNAAALILLFFTLIALQAHGVHEKGRALVASLSNRFTAALELGLSFADFSQVETTLATYRALNPDIDFIAITEGNRIRLHTQARMVGTAFRPSPAHLVFSQPLRGVAGASVATVTVGIAKGTVYRQLWRSGKNFLILLFCSTFLASLLFTIMTTMGRRTTAELPSAEAQLDALYPIYFLLVFGEGLLASFLPQYLQGVVGRSHLPPQHASLIFTAYFFALALSLLPAGRWADRKDPRAVILAGVACYAVSMLGMCFAQHFVTCLLARALGGIGQGLTLVGVQGYFLRDTSPGVQAKGSTLIVLGFNGGTLAGTAIGALLVEFLREGAIFAIGACITLLTLGYVLTLIPALPSPPRAHEAGGHVPFWATVRTMLRDADFMKTLLLVGLTTKMVFAGVAIYAMPLLLHRHRIAQDDIGQILMLYSIGVLLSSHVVTRLFATRINTRPLLFWGMIGSGCALLLIGLMGTGPSILGLQSAAVYAVVGMLLLGLAQGFIHAPVVTHITRTPAAGAAGLSSVAASYRFVERMGHAAGPLCVGYLLALSHGAPTSLHGVGIALLICAFLFVLHLRRMAPALPVRQPEQAGGVS